MAGAVVLRKAQDGNSNNGAAGNMQKLDIGIPLLAW